MHPHSWSFLDLYLPANPLVRKAGALAKEVMIGAGEE